MMSHRTGCVQLVGEGVQKLEVVSALQAPSCCDGETADGQKI